MQTAGVVLASIGVLAGVACGAGAIRPRYAPFPTSFADTIASEPDAIIDSLLALVRAERLPLRYARAREGYLETDWFHAETGRVGGGASLDTRGIVKLRFWADPVREGVSLVVGEAVHRLVIDPSLPPRATEAPVPEGHPADVIVRRLVRAVKEPTGP